MRSIPSVKMDQASCSYTTRSNINQLNESLYELYKPPGEPSVQVIFFHGFQVGEGSDPHLSTWRSGDDSCIWPQTWLVEEFPNAHVLTVSYTACLLHNSTGGKVDMFLTAENLLSDLLQAKVGQDPRCPVVLVAHSFGGLVMKELCLHARKTDAPEHQNFLSTVKGFFFYSTPHRGIPNVGDFISRFLSDSLLLEYVKTLSTLAARMNYEFDELLKKYQWQISGLGENLPTELHRIPAFTVVPEGSARYGSDFNVLPTADHITVCKPSKKSSTSFNKLARLLHKVSSNSMITTRPENFQHVPPNFVGMEDELEKLKGMLLKATSLGLVGMGGIGKSTLAKALFNVFVCESRSKYEYTCFLKDVKSVTTSGTHIQDAIVQNLHHWGKPMGLKKGDNMWFLTGKSLLLILDDVASEEKDLEVVTILQKTIVIHEDSRFVATSRDHALLKRCLDEVNSLEFLSLDTSKTLLLSYAFPKGVPTSFTGDIEGIVKKCGGLPLALEVIGKYLHNKSSEIWQEAVIALSNNAKGIHGVQEKLMSTLQLSYDGLNGEEKDMFLDAATVLLGRSVAFAKSLWSSSTSCLHHACWEHLVDLSLVWEVHSYGSIEIGMHEQLQSLARQIGSIPGGNGRWLWERWELGDRLNAEEFERSKRAWRALRSADLDDLKDIVALYLDKDECSLGETMTSDQTEISCLHFLKALKEDVLQCMGMTSDSECCVGKSMLCKMEKLRYLQLCGVHIAGTDGELPSTLVYFYYRGHFTEVPFNPAHHKRMVFLHLTSDELRTVPSNFGQLSGLKELRIRSRKLKSLPDSFGELLWLEKVIFTDCEFAKLPETFGRLKNLKRLTLRETEKLKALPQSFGELSQLQSLQLVHCRELQTLSDSFGRLKNLNELDIWVAPKLRALPASFGGLAQLQSLELHSCDELQTFPDSFGNLSKLRTLEITHCEKFRKLPDTFGDLGTSEEPRIPGSSASSTLGDSFRRLAVLKKLEISDCRALEELPKTLGNLVSLEELTVDGCGCLSALPDSLGQLAMLKILRIKNCATLEKVPEAVGNLTSLEQLYLKDCKCLSAIPDSLGQLAMLKILRIENCATLEKVPEAVGNLTSLEELYLKGCKCLSAIPDSLGQLAMLKILRIENCATLEKVPEAVGNLTSLEQLYLKDCKCLSAIPDSLGQLAMLKILRIEKCATLEKVPEAVGNLTSLEQLYLKDCKCLSAIPDSLGQLAMLKILRIENCATLEKVPEAVGNLTSLEELYLKGCKCLSAIPDSLGQLAMLKILRIENCATLEKVPEAVGNLTSLEELSLIDCKCVSAIPDSLGQLAMLKRLHIELDLEKLPDTLGNLLSLEKLSLSKCNSLSALPDWLPRLAKLKILMIQGCETLKLSETLGSLVSLEELWLVEWNSLSSLPDSLGDLGKLKRMTICKCEALRMLPETLVNLAGLEELRLLKLTSLPAVPDSLRSLPGLRELRVRTCDPPSLNDFVYFPRTSQLLRGSEMRREGIRLPNGKYLNHSDIFSDRIGRNSST